MNEVEYKSRTFRVGDVFSMEKWDRTEAPSKQMGICSIKRIYKGSSESGYLVDLWSEHLKTMRFGFDLNWLF